MDTNDFKICPPKLYGPSITFGLSPLELIPLAALFVFAVAAKSKLLIAAAALIFTLRFRGMNGLNIYYYLRRLLHFLTSSQKLITVDKGEDK